MQGCVAPSEIPGLSGKETSDFGGLVEDIIFADYCSQHGCGSNDVFTDNNNLAAYVYFLAIHNPQFTEAKQIDFFAQVRGAELMRIPDLLVHKPEEKAFYEIKPDSASGRAKGMEKVGTLQAVYPTFKLPYTAGIFFTPRDHTVAQLGGVLRATLQVRRVAPGLILYKLCLDSEGAIELATLILILRYIVREMNKQKGRGRFQPVDLAPLFRENQQLVDLARALGVTLLVTATAAVGWRYFWKAVAVRFAAEPRPPCWPLRPARFRSAICWRLASPSGRSWTSSA
jgi:hypothetical protein